ncbi:MAG: DUF1343 domain-containing protein [Gemmatimonadota bacterium]|nr:MAG: DUF1343 domain-containing protein [Gemmatimonadota bacterium]
MGLAMAPQSLVMAIACVALACDQAPEQAASVPHVRPGIEVLLEDSLHLVENLRVGLITNHTGVDREGRSTIDRLSESDAVDLVALFSPEHGIRGETEAGQPIDSGRDALTGLPVHSLYGRTRKPTPKDLEGLGALLFDIQDIGSRYYTYVSTMALGMEAAGEAGIPFIVLDRPNPIGGIQVQGNVLSEAFSSFVGMYPVPMRHGMTPGELARMFVGEFGVQVDLHVVPADGWTRDLAFEDLGLPWIGPSPNMPSIVSATHYVGTALFEGTNISVARGTDRPFQQIGAPWLDGALLADRLDAYGIEGVRFEAVTFTPESPGDGKFDGETVPGVRLVALDEAYDPTLAAVAMLVETRRMSGERWRWGESHFDRLAGTDRLRRDIEAGRTVSEIREGWDTALAAFLRMRERYLIYP